jgi:chemotaxis protein methyltransferase CheR
MIKLRAEERQTVVEYIHSICSIALDHSKDYLIEGRLSALAEEARCRSFSEFVSRAQSDPGGSWKRRIIDEITTNETLFFRDTAPFDLLRYKSIPEIVDHRTRTGLKTPIRIWSAACSTGQEIYSIAIVLRELLGDPCRYTIRLLGTDISDQAVARASAGFYSEMEMSRGLSPMERAKSFVPSGNGWRVRDEIRSMACFRRLNLMEDFSGLGQFDVIFCRNVAIYFNDRRLSQRMEKDGCLIIGAMESLNGICPQLESKRHLRSVFYQWKSSPTGNLS